MREISTKKIEIGEHVMIDGDEFVAEKGGCSGCKSNSFLICPYTLFCPVDGKLTKVEKPTEKQDEDTPMTQLQFAEWLSKGNGQYRFRNENIKSSLWVMYKGGEDLTVDDDILIRPWGTDEWIKPTLEIYKRDCRK